MSRLKTYCVLHHPQGKLQKGYHVLVIALSIVTGFVLNILNLNGAAPKSFLATTIIDCLLLAILSVETLLQLWSSSYRSEYCGCRGKVTYLYDHLVYKAIDLVGVLSYMVFCVRTHPVGSSYSPALAVGHLSQILQLYRLTQRQLRLIVRTIHFKFGFILSIFLFTISIFLVLSRLVYLFESGRNPKIKHIYDATWLVFVTLNCIGFGDKGPVTIEGKLLLIFVAFFGLVSFSVTISLFGAQLANEKDKASIVSLIPAATLVQNVWILHSMQLGAFWKNINLKLTERDKQAIVCLQRIKCLVSSRHFKVSQSDITSFDENVLLYEHLLNRLDFIEKNIYHNSYSLNSINHSMDAIVRDITAKRQ